MKFIYLILMLDEIIQDFKNQGVISKFFILL